MNRSLCLACLALLLCLPGCKKESQDQDQTVASQDPVLVPHAGYAEYKVGLDDLISKKGAIGHKYDELEVLRSPAPGQPVLSGQADLKVKEILTACDELETGAQQLLDQPYLQEHKGESADAQDLVNFARDIRQKLQTGS